MMSLKAKIKELYSNNPIFPAKAIWLQLISKHYKNYLYYNSRKGTWSVSLDNIHHLPTLAIVKKYIREFNNGK